MGQAHPSRNVFSFFFFLLFFSWCVYSFLKMLWGEGDRGHLTITAQAGSRPEKGIP